MLDRQLFRIEGGHCGVKQLCHLIVILFFFLLLRILCYSRLNSDLFLGDFLELLPPFFVFGELIKDRDLQNFFLILLLRIFLFSLK